MKVKILVATLAITLLLSVQGFANGFLHPCDARCVDPCGPCGWQAQRSGDLFSGLRALVNGVGARVHNCDPCEAVLACNPCDAVCASLPRLGVGNRLRNLFAQRGCFDGFDCGPCDVVVNCDPCAVVDNGCFDGCGPGFSPLRNLFSGLRLNRGCFTDCGDFNACDPCGFVADRGPCDFACNGFDACGPRFQLPRFNLFGGLRANRCIDANLCDPCDQVAAGPCDRRFFFR